MVRSKEQNDKAAPSHAASVALFSPNPIKKVSIKKTLKGLLVNENNISIMDGNIESGGIKFSTLKKGVKGDNIGGKKNVKSLLSDLEIKKKRDIVIDNGSNINTNDQSNVIMSAAGASAIPTTSIYTINTTTTTHNPSTINRKRTTRKMDGQTTTGSNSSRSTTGLSGEESKTGENRQNLLTEFRMISIEGKCNGNSPTSSNTPSNTVNNVINECHRQFRCVAYSKAKRVRFYRNGDPFFNGVVLAVSSDRFRSLTVLIEELNRILSTSASLPAGVRNIFTTDGAFKITDVEELEDGCSYVCSSVDSIKLLDYQNAKQPQWLSAHSTRLRDGMRLSTNRHYYIREENNFVYPRIITIIRNGVKPRKVYRHLLNKKTALSFEQVTAELTRLVKLDSGLIRRIFTINGKLVRCLKDFFDTEEDVFLCCGNEKVICDDFVLVQEETRLLFNRNARGSIRRRRLQSVNPEMPTRNDRLSVKSGKIGRQEDNIEKNDSGLPGELGCQMQIIRLLGDGNTANVFEVKLKETGEEQALKIVKPADIPNLDKLIESELSIMSKIDNDFIVKMFDHWYIDDQWFISLELIPEGDLFEHLRKVKSFDERSASSLIYCLSSALCYLHSIGIVHRDVKPENLLIFYDYTGEYDLPYLKLADFGLACELNDDETLLDICGTPTYVAPEILAELGYREKVDCWSTGVILYILLCGFPPFQSQNNDQEQLFEQILQGSFTFPSPMWNKISYSAKNLVCNMLTIDVDERYSAEAIFNDEWVTSLSHISPEFEDTQEFEFHDRMARKASIHQMAFDDMSGVSEDDDFYFKRQRSMDEMSASSTCNRNESPLLERKRSDSFFITNKR
uniref:non-specific serine/threonine protein kinase n=1 Tax=Strongyloides venezuelensis TaxID=75913 RepID=A0A0K0G3F0_STRVS